MSEIKQPPRQRTTVYQSDLEKSSDGNFETFLDLIASATGLRFDHGRCRIMNKSRFFYRCRLTSCRVARFVSVGCSGHVLAAQAPSELTGKRVQLLMVKRGSLVVTQRGTTQQIGRGHVWISDPSEPFIVVADESVEFAYITVSSAYFFTHSGFRVPMFLGRVFRDQTPVQHAFSEAFRFLDIQFDTVDARDGSDLCDGLFCFLRPVLSEYSRLIGKSENSRDILRMKAVDVMQRRRRQTGLTLDQIAEESGVSARYLNKLFREIGTSPMKRLMEIRLEAAAVQLREDHMSSHSIAEIAQGNGFRSQAHFAACFKAAYGCSPRQWRNSHSDIARI